VVEEIDFLVGGEKAFVLWVFQVSSNRFPGKKSMKIKTLERLEAGVVTLNVGFCFFLLM
jgi:hypothetical protein